MSKYSYQERIKELAGYAEEEGYSLKNESIDSFNKIIHSDHKFGQAGLILLDSGHLCAIWCINKDTLEIECHDENQYKVIMLYNSGILPEIFYFSLKSTLEYIDQITIE